MQENEKEERSKKKWENILTQRKMKFLQFEINGKKLL